MARAQQNFHRHRTSSHGISLGGKDKIDGRIKAGREKKEEEERMKAIHEECNRKRVNEIDWNWIWLYAPSGSSLATWISQEPTQISINQREPWLLSNLQPKTSCSVPSFVSWPAKWWCSIQRLSCYCMYCPVEGLEGLVLQVVVFEGWTHLDSQRTDDMYIYTYT